jgi:dolichyl-phosphate-mannose--protein O-mannosyl transferase
MQHLKTGKYLHSHLHRSPLSGNQEVSAYGESGKGDSGDNWKVVLPSSDHWRRGEPIQLQHIDTSLWLTSPDRKYQNPIPGQREIACIHQQTATEWASEVIYRNNM